MGPSGSRGLVSNLVVESNDPSFASTFVNSGSQVLEQLSLGTMDQAGGGALLSSSVLVGYSFTQLKDRPVLLLVGHRFWCQCFYIANSLQELGSSSRSCFNSSSPMTIDVQLGDMGHGLLGSSQLTTINQSELALGLGGENITHHSEAPEQPLSATPSPVGSLQDEDMDDFRVRGGHYFVSIAYSLSCIVF